MEAGKQSAKLAPFGKIVEKVAAIREDGSKVLSSSTPAHEHHINREALARQRELKISQLKDRERTLNWSMSSGKRELAKVKVQNASLK